MDFKYVYKICTAEEWDKAKKDGQFNGSQKDKDCLLYTSPSPRD